MVIFMILMSLVLEEDVFRALNVFYCVVKLVIEQLCLWVCVLASNERYYICILLTYGYIMLMDAT